jgi:hypothetical protein
MKRMIRSLGLLSMVVVLGGLMLSFVADNAIAQLRAALVKNVDEPGRMPYQEMVSYNGGSSPTCATSQFCIPTFSPVPAGKRLVVEHISAMIFVVNTGAPNLFTFGQGFSTNTGNVMILNHAFSLGGSIGSTNIWGIDRPVRVYYGPGEVPSVKIGASAPMGFVHNVSLHGYLIDATN